MLLMSIATPATERKLPLPNSLPLPPRWMVEECSREFGQIGVLGLPFADAPTKENSVTRPSEVNPIKPYSLEAKNAPAYWALDDLWNILATGDQTGGSYSLMEEVCSLNSGPAPHTHEQDEVIYIIEGEMTLIAGSLMSKVKAGSLAYIPAHCVHSFRVDLDKTRFLNFYFPGGFETLITESGVPATSRTLPPPGVKGPETPEQMKAISQRIGLNMIALPDVLRKAK
jgi:mannose-6-phosphate isomerase-like protein (cupin superfamily)